MSKGSARSAKKEAYWRGHLERQSSSVGSIRSYCCRHGLSEASFHFWRREIASRDREVIASPYPGNAGLVAVEIVGEISPPSMARAIMEIEVPGGPVIRVREDVSAEILQRVMRACQQSLRVEVEELVAGHGVIPRGRSC